jgi:ketosteroid isomerase-like protein
MTNGPPAHRLDSPLDDFVAATRGRRSFLQLGGAGVAAAAIGANPINGGSGRSRKQRSTEQLVRRLFHAIESGSTSAIWAFLAPAGAIEFPFVGTRYTDFASFDANIGPLLAVLPGLTFTDPDLEFLDDPEALIAKYTGHAVVTFTGKSYDQTYIAEIHTRNGKVTSMAEYFDTAVLNEAFTP